MPNPPKRVLSVPDIRIGNPVELVRIHGYEQACELARMAGANTSELRALHLAFRTLTDENDEAAFTYSAFSMTSLPHRRPSDEFDPWTKESKIVSLTLKPGTDPFFDGPENQAPLVGVPYGATARLILIYFMTRAIKEQSRSIRIDGSLNSWIQRMGRKVGGSTYKNMSDQLRRLASCHLRFKWHTASTRGFDDDKFIKSGFAMLMAKREERQPCMFSEEIILGETFYRELSQHAVPLSERAIFDLAGNSVAMDVYLWLAYRLHQLEKPTLVTWEALWKQFGSEYERCRKFKEKFTPTVALVKGVYERADLDLTSQGMMLHPSPPPIAPRLVAVK